MEPSRGSLQGKGHQIRITGRGMQTTCNNLAGRSRGINTQLSLLLVLTPYPCWKKKPKELIHTVHQCTSRDIDQRERDDKWLWRRKEKMSSTRTAFLHKNKKGRTQIHQRSTDLHCTTTSVNQVRKLQVNELSEKIKMCLYVLSTIIKHSTVNITEVPTI